MKGKNIIFSLLVTILFGGLYYYLAYPALNITNIGFWVFIIILVVVFTVCNAVFGLHLKFRDLVTNKKVYRFDNRGLLSIFLIPMIIGGILLVNFVLSPLFFSSKYYSRIKVDDALFTENVKEVDFNKIPLLDRASSEKLGDRTMGQMSELVSQFDVSNMYTQINYNDEIIRVTPLEYNGWIKWLTNRKNGIKGYITVDSVDGEAKLVKLDDNEGKPYWIASVVKYVGVGLRREVKGVVILDPTTGESKYYDVKEVPAWVDHVYESDLILEQINDWGKYKNGFINSIIGQRDVVMATEGYNYLAQDDDIYLYTGITSVVSDESNVGFVLTNMRTKETKFYGVAGAEEFSAMDSAKGQVQQMNYTATFPLLINLNNKPTYLISLKDNAGLVKMYAFVDVVDYQKVVVTDSSKGIKKAAEAYLNEMNDDIVGENSREVVINDLTSAIIDGNTYYYFKDNNGQKYKVSIKTAKNKLPFIKNGDVITVKYDKEVDVITITEVE